jgi:hypothetical protein
VTDKTIAIMCYACRGCIVEIPNTAWVRHGEWWTAGFSNKLPEQPQPTRNTDPLGQPIPGPLPPNAGVAGAGSKTETFDMTGSFTRAGYWIRAIPNNFGGREYDHAFAFVCNDVVAAGLGVNSPSEGSPSV